MDRFRLNPCAIRSFRFLLFVNFLDAVLKQIGESALHQLQGINGSLYRPLPSLPLGNFKVLYFFASVCLNRIKERAAGLNRRSVASPLSVVVDLRLASLDMLL